MVSSTFFDEEGRPSFNALQNFGSSPAPVVYYVFDLMVLGGRDLRREPLEKRRALLEKRVLPKLTAPVHHTVDLDAPLPVLSESVKAQGFEGLVAKRLDSCYEPGLRSGAWMKMRVNRGQEFVIGGYTHGTKTLMHSCSGTTKARISSTSRERATGSLRRLGWRCSNDSRGWRPRPARSSICPIRGPAAGVRD